jgi:hypothetical protein
MTEQPPFAPQLQYAQPQYAPQPPAQAPYPHSPYQRPEHSDIGFYPLAAPHGAPGPPPTKSRKIAIIVGAATAGLVLAVGGVTALLMTARGDTGRQAAAAVGVPVVEARSPFQDVQASCDPTGEGTKIADNGKTLLVDSRGEEDYTGISYDSMTCIFNAITMPTAVQAHVGDTRALDGRQEDSWDGFTASWSYHPDQGMDMIIRAA